MNLLAKISNVFVIFTVAMVKTIAVIIRMKLAARKTTVHAQLDNSLAQMVNALIITWFVIKFRTVLMIRMNRYIVMLMSAPKWKSINADINVLIH